MRRFAMKALFTVLNLNRTGRSRIAWDRAVTILSTGVTLALLVLHVWGKTTARW
jgi:hypothetical protein